MSVSSDLFIRVLLRKPCSLTEMANLLRDPRSKRLTLAVAKLKKTMRHLDRLIDPEIEEVPEKYLRSGMPEKLLASMSKRWLAKIRQPLIGGFSRLTANIQEIYTVLLSTRLAVEEITELKDNLAQRYGQIMLEIAKINTALSNIEGSVFPDEIIHYIATMHKTWIELQMMLTGQIVTPLTSEIREAARTNTLKKIAVIIHGGK